MYVKANVRRRGWSRGGVGGRNRVCMSVWRIDRGGEGRSDRLMRGGV